MNAIVYIIAVKFYLIYEIIYYWDLFENVCQNYELSIVLRKIKIELS